MPSLYKLNFVTILVVGGPCLRFKGFKSSSKQGEKSKPSFDHDQDKELQSRILNLRLTMVWYCSNMSCVWSIGLRMTAPPFVFDVRSQVANHTYKCMFPNNLILRGRFYKYTLDCSDIYQHS
jgi:hypothetical protein